MTHDDQDLVVRGASVLSTDPAYDGRAADVLVRGGRIAAVGAEAAREAGPSARLVDARGATLVPLMDATVRERWGPDDPAAPGPGSEASFVVVEGAVSQHAALHQLVVPPSRLLVAVVDGRVAAEHGRPVVGHDAHAAATGQDDPRWGTWRDRTGFLDQHLFPGGRYAETRAGRPNAYTGACWLHRERIVYLDDTGFWAFGRFVHDELHHAGFVMDRLP